MRAPRIVIAFGALLGAAAIGAVSTHAVDASPTVGTVYQSVESGNITLGNQANATRVLTTKAIPVGKYTVTANVGIVLGPAPQAGQQEGVVCAVGTTASGDVVNTAFGGGGNGATESGTDFAGVYGNALVTGSVVINNASDHLTVTCNSTTGTQGTYVSSVQLIAAAESSIVAK